MGKRGRRKRRQNEPPRPNQKTRRRLECARRELAERIIDALLDPGVPARDAVAALVEHQEGRPVSIPLVWTLCATAPQGRAGEIAEAALAREAPSVPALTLAATVAEEQGDLERAAPLFEAAAALTDDPMVHWCRARTLVALGSAAAACAVLRPPLRDNPTDEPSQDLYRDALRLAWQRRDLSRREACPCGSSKRYGRCCRDAERAALRRFADRQPLYELRAAVGTYLERPKFERHMERAAQSWMEFGDPGTLIDGEGLDRLFEEWAVMCVPVDDGDGGQDFDGGDPDGDDSVMAGFAADPRVDPALRAAAQVWSESARFGLWQVRDPRPEPGVELVDLLTGARVYAAAAPEQLEGLAPWTVLLGYVGALDGIWRTGGAFLPLPPAVADALSVDVYELAADFIERDSRSRGKRTRVPRPDHLDLPRSALVDEIEPASLEVASFSSALVGAALPMILERALVHSAPPRLTNTDGHPLQLITAGIALTDPAVLTEALAAHPDFDLIDDRITWLDREMTPAEAETAREGGELVEDHGPPRWVRGHLRVEDGLVVAELNSEERLDALIGELRALGTSPEVVSRTTFDPKEDLPDPRESAPVPDDQDNHGMSPEALDAWARAWVDEPVPALGGITPREAAADPEGRIKLEALLRDFEHRAAAATARYRHAVDVEWLRAELGMTTRSLLV